MKNDISIDQQGRFYIAALGGNPAFVFEKVGNYLCIDQDLFTYRPYNGSNKPSLIRPDCFFKKRRSEDPWLSKSFRKSLGDCDPEMQAGIYQFLDENLEEIPSLKVPLVAGVTSPEEVRERFAEKDFIWELLTKEQETKDALDRSISVAECALEESGAEKICLKYPLIRGGVRDLKELYWDEDQYNLEFVRSRVRNYTKERMEQLIAKAKEPYSQSERLAELITNGVPAAETIQTLGFSKWAAETVKYSAECVDFIRKKMPMDDRLICAILFGSAAEQEFSPSDADLIFVTERGDSNAINLPKEMARKIGGSNAVYCPEDFEAAILEDKPDGVPMRFVVADRTLSLFGGDEAQSFKDRAISLIEQDEDALGVDPFVEYLRGTKYFTEADRRWLASIPAGGFVTTH